MFKSLLTLFHKSPPPPPARSRKSSSSSSGSRRDERKPVRREEIRPSSGTSKIHPDEGRGTLYCFKRDVLMIVAKLNQGIPHEDCEILKRQTIFVQSQLFHSLYNDPDVPLHTKQLLRDYHIRSVKATLGDRRGAKMRDLSHDDTDLDHDTVPQPRLQEPPPSPTPPPTERVSSLQSAPTDSFPLLDDILLPGKTPQHT